MFYYNIKMLSNVDYTVLQLKSEYFLTYLWHLTVVYLSGGSDVRVDDLIEVFMNSVKQPEEEFLGIVLGVTFELKGALRHHILQQTT